MASQGSPLSIFQDLPVRGDRRRSVRHKAHTPAYASFNGLGGGMVLDLSEVLNLSETGVAIQATSPLPLDRNLNIVLDLSETKAYINTSGVIVWSDKEGRAGIRFAKLPDPSLRLMKEWLFVNCLVALAKSRVSTPPAQRELANPLVIERVAIDRPREIPSAAASEPLQDHVAHVPTLGDTQRELEALGSDTESALHLIADRARLMTHASGCAIALASGTEMVCRAFSGDAPPLGARFNADTGFSGECVRTATLQRCDDAEVDPLVDRESCRRLGVRSMIASPVIANGTVIGLLEVFSPVAHCFRESDSASLRQLADLTANSVRMSVLSDARTRSTAPLDLAVDPASEIREDRENWLGTLTRNKSVLITAMTLLVVGIAAVAFTSRIWRSPVAAAVSTPPSQPAPVQDQPIHAPAGTLDELRKYAAQGDPVAQFALGARYAQGDGVKQDYAEAARWFQQAAEKGHVVAQATLGAYYWAGRGVPQDLNKAYFWSLLARAGGDEASKYRVAALTSRMSRPQILQAQQLAESWLHSHQAGLNPNP